MAYKIRFISTFKHKDVMYIGVSWPYYLKYPLYLKYVCPVVWKWACNMKSAGQKMVKHMDICGTPNSNIKVGHFCITCGLNFSIGYETPMNTIQNTQNSTSWLNRPKLKPFIIVIDTSILRKFKVQSVLFTSWSWWYRYC